MAYTVIRRYMVEQPNVDETVRRAIEGFMPLIQNALGFLAYRLVKANVDILITTSTFETRGQSDELSRMADEWIKENLNPLVPDPAFVIGGEVRVRHVIASEQATFGIMRRYPRVSDVAEASRRVETGFLPIISKLPGFGSYLFVDPGDGSAVALSNFRDRATAEQASQKAHDWGRQNFARFLLDPPETTTGEIVGGAFK